MEEKKADALNEQASFEGSRWVGVGGWGAGRQREMEESDGFMVFLR